MDRTARMGKPRRDRGLWWAALDLQRRGVWAFWVSSLGLGWPRKTWCGCAWLPTMQRQQSQTRVPSKRFSSFAPSSSWKTSIFARRSRFAHAFGDIVGESSALRKVLAQVELVAPADTSVLILGESGTGKELVARAIHERSGRSDRPMIRVNCGSIPRELFESEFFGHVEGAFTGAVRDRAGRFQLADGGTLFLDEVAEIPLDLQSKLLRVLQEGTFERIGEEKTQHVDVRIIAATNRDLKKDVEEKRFRQDLYYRLSVFPVEVAPLRETGGGHPSASRQLPESDLPASRPSGVQTQGSGMSKHCRATNGPETFGSCRTLSSEP